MEMRRIRIFGREREREREREKLTRVREVRNCIASMASRSGGGRPPTGGGGPNGHQPAGSGRPRRLYVRTPEEYMAAELRAAEARRQRGLREVLWRHVLEAEIDVLVSRQCLDYYCTWERLGGRDPRSVFYSQAEMEWVLNRYRSVPRFAALHDTAANTVHQFGLSPRRYGQLCGQDPRVVPLDCYMLLLRSAACMRRAGFLIEMID